MLRQISDYLFMGSLLLLVITVFIKGAGGHGMTNYGNVEHASGAATDLQMEHNHKKIIDRQDTIFGRLLRSYLFWISVAGIIVSIVLSKI